MNRRKISIIFSLILLISLVVVQFPPLISTADPLWEDVERGETFIKKRKIGTDTYSWESAPQWIFDGSQYVPYIYYRDDAKKCYAIQSGVIGAEIYDTGIAKFYDPQLTEERVKSEKWEIWFLDKDVWKQATLSSTINFNITQEQSYIMLETKQTTSKPDGILTIQYLFYEGVSLKHNVVWESTNSVVETIQIKQVWDLKLSINKVSLETENATMISHTSNSTIYVFGDNENDFLVQESQWSATYYPDGSLRENGFIEADIDFSGKKVTFVFGNWTLSNGERLEIDPATATLNNPWVDGYVTKHNTGVYSGRDDVDRLRVGDIGVHPWDDWEWRSYAIWSIGGIPANADISLMKFKYECTVFSDVHRAFIRQILEGSQDWGSYSDGQKYSDIATGNVYGMLEPASTGQNKEYTLLEQAELDLEASLSGSLALWGIGLFDVDNNHATPFNLASEELPGTPNPTLYVEYLVVFHDPTITSSTITDMDDTDNLYAMNQYYTFQIVVDDGNGADNIAMVYVQCRQGVTVRFEVRATGLNTTPAYAIQTGASIIDLDDVSCSWGEAGNVGTLTLSIRIEWDYIPDENNLELAVYVEDEDGNSTGFTVMQTDYFDIIARLVTTGFDSNATYVQVNGGVELFGYVRYCTTVDGTVDSTSYPPDAEFIAVHIHDSSHVSVGNDAAIVDGYFSIEFNIPGAVQANIYHVYLDMGG